MAEHWKSTPRYWCKHCATYVRDTRLERTNHEATARHQSAVKRALRTLHRGKEAEDRERERAKREIERLNGVVGDKNNNNKTTQQQQAASGGGGGQEERKRQAEQLALLGVAVPDTMRGDLAMAGEWTVTSTVVVSEEGGDTKELLAGKAKGVRKREHKDDDDDEDDDEAKKEAEEAAVAGLFKKPRRWGRESHQAVGDQDGKEDLDALLSGELGPPPPTIKKEEGAEEEKEEEKTVPVVAFKKRKAKNIRQK